MKKIFKELLAYKLATLFIALTVIGGVLCNLGLPAYLSNIINFGIPNADMTYIVKTGGTMLILAILGALFNITMGFFSAKVSMGIGKNLRSKVFSKVQYFSQTEFDSFSTSSLITRTNNDITQVQNFINMFLRIILMAPIMFIGGIVLAYAKSPSMSTILVISMPIMIISIIAIAYFAMPISKRMQALIDKINLVMREKLTGIRVIRAFGTSDYEAERFMHVNQDYMRNSMRMGRIMGLLTPVLSFVMYATTVGLLYFGSTQIRTGSIDLPIGNIIAVIQYVMQIMMSVMMLSMVFIMYPRASVSAKRINEVMDTEAVIVNPEQTRDNPNEQGYLTFKNVSFTFPGAEEPAIRDISFAAKPGEITAIIGSTGSGKSSIVNLIPRFYDVQQGEILIDNVNVKEYDLSILRRKIGYVQQKAFLFKGTIASNIMFGDDNASEAQVKEAAKIAQAYDFISKKDDGFNSPIAQGGGNVSGGQKQRLAITRAIVRKPEIYVFDDSFSALDFKTDAAVRHALKAETKNATVVLVAQRVSTIMDATRILVLEEGECVGMGTHKELLQSCEIYREIVRSQLGEEEMRA